MSKIEIKDNYLGRLVKMTQLIIQNLVSSTRLHFNVGFPLINRVSGHTLSEYYERLPTRKFIYIYIYPWIKCVRKQSEED